MRVNIKLNIPKVSIEGLPTIKVRVKGLPQTDIPNLADLAVMLLPAVTYSSNLDHSDHLLDHSNRQIKQLEEKVTGLRDITARQDHIIVQQLKARESYAAEMTAAIDSQKRELEQLKAQLDDMNASFSELGNEYLNLQTQNTNLLAENQERLEKLTALTSELAYAKASYQDFEVTNNNLLEENARLRNELATLKEANSALASRGARHLAN